MPTIGVKLCVFASIGVALKLFAFVVAWKSPVGVSEGSIPVIELNQSLPLPTPVVGTPGPAVTPGVLPTGEVVPVVPTGWVVPVPVGVEVVPVGVVLVLDEYVGIVTPFANE
jgi:hypothetical protein